MTELTTMTANDYSNEVYNIINRYASNNTWFQGLSGLVGFPLTLATDLDAVFVYYKPMHDELRELYKREPMDRGLLKAYISGCRTELLADLIVDKVGGNIPLLGIPANMLAAKAMTWRLGIITAMLAARGESVSEENVKKAAAAVRNVFTLKDSFLLGKKPSRELVKNLLDGVAGVSKEDFNRRMEWLTKQMASV